MILSIYYLKISLLTKPQRLVNSTDGDSNTFVGYYASNQD